MMKKILTSAESRQFDNHIIESRKIPGIILMEQAASGLAYVVSERFSANRNVAVLCGSGNNGGDGYACSRILLSKGFKVRCIDLSGKKLPPDAETMRDIIISYENVYYRAESSETLKQLLIGADVIIDAIFGTGLSRAPEGFYNDVIEIVNSSGIPVVSADVPSGVFADSGVFVNAVKADITVAFQHLKPAHVIYPACSMCGETITVPIAAEDDFIDSEFFYVDELRLPKRKRNSNKGNYGRLGILAGSTGMAGAAVLAASASVAAGSGLTRVFCPSTVLQAVQKNVVEATAYISGTDHLEAGMLDFEVLRASTAIAAGPGLGKDSSVRDIVLDIIGLGIPKVLDADALNSLQGSDLEKAVNTVITPHPKEFSRLFNVELSDVLADPVSYARKFAAQYGIVILLKGASTVVTDGNTTYITNTGTPAMAKGGSGDVLTGVTGSFLAQGMETIKAAYYAAYYCGRAGELAAADSSEYSASALDTVKNLGKAFAQA